MKITPTALCQILLTLYSLLKLKAGRDVQRRWESCSLDSIRRCFFRQTEHSLIVRSVTLQISHLQENDSHIKRSYTFSEPPTIPQILKYTSSTKLGEELDQAQDVTALDATTVALVDSETPSTVVQDHGETLLATQDLESEEFPAVFTSNMDAQATTETEMQPESEPASSAELTHRKQTGSSRVDESLDTESSNVPIVKRTIREMMQLEHMTQGDTQTQHFFHPPHPEGTAPRRTSTRLRASTSAPKTTLSQAMVKILDESEATLRKTASRLTKSEGRNKQNSNLVLCQCGSAEEEGDMVSQSAAVQITFISNIRSEVKCVYCNTWQHLHCYGYTGEDDTRIPADDYVCYQCLLGGREEGRLEMLAQIAVKRRAMYLAEQQGLTTQRDFAAKLGMILCPKYSVRFLTVSPGLDTAVAKPVYHYLKNEGYIVSVGGAHKKAKFVAVKDGPKHEKMLKDLFDPFMHISHHVSTGVVTGYNKIANTRKYDLPAKYDTQKKSLGRQLLSSQASIMPPPKTPASGLRRDPTTSPSTGLDFRASMPTLETPSRAPSLRHQSSKRSRDEDAAIETSAKRHAGPSLRQRGQSSQSEFLLDASGLASSPAAPQTPAGTFTAL